MTTKGITSPSHFHILVDSSFISLKDDVFVTGSYQSRFLGMKIKACEQ